jgi:hypothetical protein
MVMAYYLLRTHRHEFEHWLGSRRAGSLDPRLAAWVLRHLGIRSVTWGLVVNPFATLQWHYVLRPLAALLRPRAERREAVV